MKDSTTARELRETLRPLLRRLSSERTISLGKMGVLGHLAEHGAATASALAAAERISPQAVTVAVRELETQGLVMRQHDDDDRRRIWVDLTAAGREKLEQERAAGLGWLDQAIGEKLTAQERGALEAVIPVLRKLVAEPTVE